MTRTSPTHRISIQLALAAALLFCTALAQAQYMWIDATGIKQVSDRPPPPSVPYKNILKAPSGQYSASNLPKPDPAAASTSETATAALPAATPAKPAPTLAEREADYVKRQKEKADKEKKDREENDKRTAMAENCLSAAANKAALDSGRALSTVGKNGERVVMDEAARAAQSKKMADALAGCKNL